MPANTVATYTRVFAVETNFLQAAAGWVEGEYGATGAYIRDGLRVSNASFIKLRPTFSWATPSVDLAASWIR